MFFHVVKIFFWMRGRSIFFFDLSPARAGCCSCVKQSMSFNHGCFRNLPETRAFPFPFSHAFLFPIFYFCFSCYFIALLPSIMHFLLFQFYISLFVSTICIPCIYFSFICIHGCVRFCLFPSFPSPFSLQVSLLCLHHAPLRLMCFESV